ncbi:uncharacterized protein SPPG_04380 [Spizellomyces punctatus DAOM BR117]|uniref:Reticulon-like protein n=1 Tax=Spizellomyces punctatus (strain DAOM BR117) TaxID=645134 RepID=A0A0L0HEZ4_SPIPD|nr:uncharacterized protein SPPG_04380 [Spizellomyces punctatus DAOM BR117]KND00036.1 hypothetical protein SPPG_04380 [Spizellomyces punctatus DAOM BR117]|eukprot:XP_016608075.1 hypothetical protein SPPG_04380 [Spizellomyces punctatus DAOM BR117]
MSDVSTDSHFLSANATDTDSTATSALPPTIQDIFPGANPNSATKEDLRTMDSNVDTTVSTPMAVHHDVGGGKARVTEGGVTTDKSVYVKSYIRSLLLWERPLYSLAAVSTLLSLNYALTHYSPIRILSFLLASATFANMVFVNLWVYSGSLFVNVQQHGGVKKPPTMWFLDHANRQPVNRNLVRDWVDFVVDTINLAFSYVASIIAVDDNVRSAKALLFTGFVYLLSGYISSSTLFYTAVILTFATPRLYLANRAQIDTYLHTASDAFAKHTHKITDSLSIYLNTAAARARMKVEEAKGKVKKHE